MIIQHLNFLEFSKSLQIYLLKTSCRNLRLFLFKLSTNSSEKSRANNMRILHNAPREEEQKHFLNMKRHKAFHTIYFYILEILKGGGKTSRSDSGRQIFFRKLQNFTVTSHQTMAGGKSSYFSRSNLTITVSNRMSCFCSILLFFFGTHTHNLPKFSAAVL